jgi:hypothetical protein
VEKLQGEFLYFLLLLFLGLICRRQENQVASTLFSSNGEIHLMVEIPCMVLGGSESRLLEMHYLFWSLG